MTKSLFIVESPGKVSKIQKFLGDNVIVAASIGHVCDLEKSKENPLGVDVDNNFKPTYKISDDKKKVVTDLKNKLKKCPGGIIMASDADREGHAIAHHVNRIINGGKTNNLKRIVYVEITKKAILHAIENPIEIDVNQFNSQQARRIVDRLVGFKITPTLWKYVQANYQKGSSLSAGRVQSCVLKLVIDREKEIEDFENSMYYNLKGNLKYVEDIIPVKSSKKFDNKEEIIKIFDLTKTEKFIVKDIKEKEKKQNPSAPFITSSLQIEANSKLGMGSQMTMSICQSLYEKGHITYHRTDSKALSDEALNQIKEFILENYSEEYYTFRTYDGKKKTKSKKKDDKKPEAQEAHEAIRPVYIVNTPDELDISHDERRVYSLIWKRTVSGQMSSCIKDALTITIRLKKNDFNSEYEKIKFDGFMILFNVDMEAKNESLLKLKVDDELDFIDFNAEQKLTTPPTRFNDGTLVKILEDKGIGRPSTYTSSVNSVLGKDYCERRDTEGVETKLEVLTYNNNDELNETINTIQYGADKNKIVPTVIGKTVNTFLVDNFDDIINYNFTANLEQQLDIIAQGQKDWVDVVREVYTLLITDINKISINPIKKSYNNNVIGLHPDTNQEISTYLGKFGLCLKLAADDNQKKDRFVSLKNFKSVEDVTLEIALDLLKYPKLIGEHNGNEIMLNLGPYGTYLKCDGKNVTIPKDLNNDDITLEKAIELIDVKKEVKSNVIKKIKKYTIMKGQFGPYINYNNKNYSIYLDKKMSEEDKDKYLEDIDEKEIKKFMEEAKTKKKKPYTKKNKTEDK